MEHRSFKLDSMFKSPAIHRTPLYRARAAYANMVRRCGNGTGEDPAYAAVELRMTRDEWLAWAIPRYARFARRYPNKSPSVSRKDDKGHYEIGNVEIVSMAANRARQAAPNLARPDGTKRCGGRCKRVKTVNDFNKNAHRPDGLQHECRDCRALRGKRRTRS